MVTTSGTGMSPQGIGHLVNHAMSCLQTVKARVTSDATRYRAQSLKDATHRCFEALIVSAMRYRESYGLGVVYMLALAHGLFMASLAPPAPLVSVIRTHVHRYSYSIFQGILMETMAELIRSVGGQFYLDKPEFMVWSNEIKRNMMTSFDALAEAVDNLDSPPDHIPFCIVQETRSDKPVCALTEAANWTVISDSARAVYSKHVTHFRRMNLCL